MLLAEGGAGDGALHAIDVLKMVLGMAGVLVLAGFMPFSAYSFFKYRLPKKSKQYDKMLKSLGYRRDEDAPAYVPKLDEEFHKRDYYAPVAFATVIVMLGAIILVFGGDLLRQIGMVVGKDGKLPDHVNLLLQGPSLAAVPNQRPAVLGMLVMGLAFAGAYIWSVQNLFRRLATLDLSPGVYYSVGVRIIFSIFVALMLYYALASDPADSHGDAGRAATIAIAAFIAGIFPQRALQFLKEKTEAFMSPARDKADPLPLEMIEGIESFEKLRLAEVGIDNAQNLGKAHFLELIIRTPFNPREVIDWIGQARLYLFFKDEVEKLRGASIRTIFDFKKIACVEHGVKRLAQQSGIPQERLEIVADIVRDDPDINHLESAIGKLVGFPTRTDDGCGEPRHTDR